MNTQYLSLAEVADHMEVYEQLPVPLQKAMRNSLVITLVTNLACLPLLIFMPHITNFLANVSQTGFFIWFTGDLAHFIARALAAVSPILLVLNIVSLALTLLVMLLSNGMTAPVKEGVHWLAWVAAFPSGASAVSMGILAGGFALIIVLAVIIWAILIVVAICALGIALAMMGGSS